MHMARNVLTLFALLSLFIELATSADWNILHYVKREKGSLRNYCESWRLNVELHNIKDFKFVPQECTEFIGKYMGSTQYKVDSQRAVEECKLYISTCCGFKGDGKDAWIFDVDDTLISTLPYFKMHNFGGDGLNFTSFEAWMMKNKAPALDHSLELFHEIREKGLKIFLISTRRENLRSRTVDNLIDVGYHGWSKLILRGLEDEFKQVKTYKAEIREQLVNEGYRIWGILGDQWSSFEGLPSAERTFKLPNSLYYIA